jgi:hypothetical protein
MARPPHCDDCFEILAWKRDPESPTPRTLYVVSRRVWGPTGLESWNEAELCEVCLLKRIGAVYAPS